MNGPRGGMHFRAAFAGVIPHAAFVGQVRHVVQLYCSAKSIMKTITIISVCLLISAGFGLADEPTQSAETVESKGLKLGKARLEECRKLFTEGNEDEAMKLANESIDVFVAPSPKLRNVGIGVINTEKYRIEVHINTSEAERAASKPPITRPYSFLVYSRGEKPKFLYALDFEHGHDDGKLASAALGRMRNGHINYGILDVSSKFSDVKKRALEIIKSEIETKD